MTLGIPFRFNGLNDRLHDCRNTLLAIGTDDLCFQFNGDGLFFNGFNVRSVPWRFLRIRNPKALRHGEEDAQAHKGRGESQAPQRHHKPPPQGETIVQLPSPQAFHGWGSDAQLETGVMDHGIQATHHIGQLPIVQLHVVVVPWAAILFPESQAMAPMPWGNGGRPVSAHALPGLATDDVASIGEQGVHQCFQMGSAACEAHMLLQVQGELLQLCDGAFVPFLSPLTQQAETAAQKRVLNRVHGQ